MLRGFNGMKVLVLVGNGVDETVMSSMQRAWVAAGAELKTVGAESGVVSSWTGKGWGLYFPVDANINATLGSDFDLLLVPSGERSVNKLISNPHSERIISSFVAAGKPMCFVGDAARLLEAAGYNADETALCVVAPANDDVMSIMDRVADCVMLSKESRMVA